MPVLSLDGRRLVGPDGLSVLLAEDRDGVVTGSTSGGPVVRGTLVGRRNDLALLWSVSSLLADGTCVAAEASGRVEDAGDGLVRVHLSTGAVLEEVAGPRWVRGRVVRGCASPDASAEFYGALGLALDGPHVDLLIVALPGGGSLELSVGAPAPSSDLLVLYLATSASVPALVAAAGLTPVPSDDPYWARYGTTVLDPDGHRIVLTAPPGL